MNFLYSNRVTGIDIGAKSLKVVSIIPKQQQYILKKWSIKEFTDITSQELNLEEKQVVIVNLLKEIFSKDISLPRKVNISVAGPSVVIRYVKLPLMTKEELSKSISIEVEPYIPFPLSEVYLGFDIVGEIVDEGVKKNEVVIAAAKKEIVDTKLDILKQAKLIPKFIDVDAFVLERVVGYNYEISNDIVCVVNIGVNVTSVNIIENGTTKVSRDLLLGLNYIINEIKKSTQLDNKQILEIINKDGLVISDQQKEEYILQDKKLELSISKLLASVFKEIITEIRKIIDFYYFQKGEQKPLSKIFLNGIGCTIKNIDFYFSSEFKIEVEILDPLKKVFNSENVPQEIRPLLSIAVGLAMKKI
ncbi:MAG: type IV pilus assembly protein PilM [Endomicrobia bacterium]|nr:type IV pilus assembly protein PilM [Endomicrobiia bacterium]